MTCQGATLMEICGWYHCCIWVLAGSSCGLAALSLPVGICTHFMMRALGTQSRVLSKLTAGAFGMADGSMMTGVVITHKMLSLTFFAIDTIAFWAVVGTLCTDSSSYSIACPVPSPISLLVRLVITKVSWSSLDSRHLWCTNSNSLGMPSAPNPRTYRLTSP